MPVSLIYSCRIWRSVTVIMEPIESHAFYQCIRGFLYMQRLGGGRIQRPKSQQTGLCTYYALEMYCIFCNMLAIGVLVRVAFFFSDGVSVDTESIYAYLTISMLITSSVAQVVSFYSYGGILSFWDSLLTVMPQKFSGNLFKTRIVLRLMTIFVTFYVIGSYAFGGYFSFQGHLHPVYIRLAKPWTATSTQARISYTVTLACTLPSFISWNSATLFFMTGSYYLRAGFKELYKAMANDSQMVVRLSTYKKLHLRLSQITENLDSTLRGIIGTSLLMAMFDMCIIIFSLNSKNDISIFLGSIAKLYITVATLLVIAVMSISINTWVCLLTSYSICILAQFSGISVYRCSCLQMQAFVHVKLLTVKDIFVMASISLVLTVIITWLLCFSPASID